MHLSSASLANFASGNTLMLIRSPPHCLYIKLSARVENCGPSMHTMHLSVNRGTPRPSSAFSTRGASHLMNLLLKGSPNIVCATIDVSWKNDAGRTPFVRSMICEGRMNAPGEISSRREPTAEKATMARTPSDLSAAMFARPGTAEGLMTCPTPWRAMNATWVPEGRLAMVMGELGNPHG